MSMTGVGGGGTPLLPPLVIPELSKLMKIPQPQTCLPI